MRAMVLAALAAVLLATTAHGTAAAAAQKGTLKCGPKDRWCIATLYKHGRLFFDAYSFDHGGKYRLCVRPPSSSERCKTFKLIPNGTGANASSVRFSTNFPHRRKGKYRVRWIVGGKQLGPALPFSV